jgi:phosphate/sulfate permease
VTASLWQTLNQLPVQSVIFFGMALLIAFGFEFINGFHDTANAVTTVIYTGTLKPTPAVVYSGICNFLGVLVGGTAVAFSIVNLLPVDLLIDSASVRAIVMVVSLLLAGVTWNLATWWYGLPVSSSHTLIGSILGVGLANSLMTRGDVSGINWAKALEVSLSLLISPVIGFVAASVLLLTMKRFIREPRLYHPPGEGDNPPHWIRGVLLATCGGVSFAHGSNDGQKGMGLILLVLIGFLPAYYALDLNHPTRAKDVCLAAISCRDILTKEKLGPQTAGLLADLDTITSALEGKSSFAQVELAARWSIRQSIYRFRKEIGLAGLSPAVHEAVKSQSKPFSEAIEYVPTWVILGVALALGIGTMIGYQRIVVTVAEKIGKTHLTYAQGAAAELVAAVTIGLADTFHMPVSTTHVLSSGVAGTMWANKSGLQGDTIRKIGLVWVTTLPAAVLLAAALFTTGGYLIPSAGPPPRKSVSAALAPEPPAERLRQIGPEETGPR